MATPFQQPVPAEQVRLGFGAFAFRPGDMSLRRAWNQAQANFIGSPEHLALIERFGFSAAELPGSVLTADLVKSP